jgi:rhodanese-related sulfurtransferase
MKKLVKLFALAIILVTAVTSCTDEATIRKRAAANAPKPVIKIVEAIAPANLGKINKVAVAAFEKALETATLVDVRTPEEFAAGHLKGAVNINFKKRTFPNYINAIAKDKPVAIYCRSGNRSGKAAFIMQSLGFKEVIDLGSGYKGWNKAGKEVVKEDNDANKKLQETLAKGELKGAAVVGKSHQIGVDEFEKLAKSGKVTVVDVRTAKEFAAGHIAGAINVDWKNRHFAKEAIKNITNDKPAAIYCRSGNRATRAMFAMAALGFNEVYNLDHGMKSWNAANKPVKTLEVKGDKHHLDVANFNNGILGKVGKLVDIRTPKEYNASHIPGAVMIDYKNDNFKEEFSKLDKKVPVLIYCRSGGRSGRATKVLTKMGYDVYNLDKGFNKWKAEGMSQEGDSVGAAPAGGAEEGC